MWILHTNLRQRVQIRMTPSIDRSTGTPVPVFIAFSIPRTLLSQTARPPHVALETNMSHHSYSYLERRYGKKTRLQVLLLMTGMVVALIGAIATVQMSETDAEKNARVESELKSERNVDRKNLIEQQEYYLSVACEHGKAACDKAKEEVQKQNCQMFGENCQRNQKPNSTASYPTIP
jgi:hypothetical protein